MSPENRLFDNEGENHETTTGTPHPGGENVPEEVRERPVVEYNTSLDEAYRQGLLNTDPEDPFKGFEAAPPQAGEKAGFDQKSSQVRNSYVEAPKKSKKGLIIGGVASLAVAGVAVFGVNALANKDVTPTEPTNPDATAPVAPGETQAPTDTPTTPEVTPSPTDIPTTFEPTPSATEAPSTPSETEQGSEYTASELREMPLNDYLALSATEREPLVTAMLEQSKDWSGEFGESFIANEETDRPISDLYKFNPLDIASEDNSAKEIAMQHLHWMQLALMQTEDLDTSGTFDPDIATKALAGGFTQPGYVTGGGQDTLTKGMNAEFDYWKSTFSRLDTVTSHDYAQKISDAEFVDEGYIRNNQTGERHKVVSISFTTEALPETLADSYVAGTKTVGNLSFVWNEDLNRWQAYKGLTENRPVGQ